MRRIYKKTYNPRFKNGLSLFSNCLSFIWSDIFFFQIFGQIFGQIFTPPLDVVMKFQLLCEKATDFFFVGNDALKLFWDDVWADKKALLSFVWVV
jgi:hypothetical protein